MTQKMTRDRLEAIARRLEQATPGPWRVDGRWIGATHASVMLAQVTGDCSVDEANAALMASAPQDLTDLLAHSAALAGELERLELLLESHDICSTCGEQGGGCQLIEGQCAGVWRP